MESNKLATLNKRSEFNSLKESGTRVQVNRWMLFSYRRNDVNHMRLGMTFSAKVGNAVVRNRLKRWSREYFRMAQADLKLGIDLNVILRPTGDDFYKNISREEYVASLEKGWKKLKLA